MNTRRAVQYAGGAAIVVGLGITLAGTTVSMPILGDYRTVLVAAVLSAIVGAGFAYAAGDVTGEWWRPVDTETGHRVPVPGDDLDGARENRIRERVRERAVETLVRSRSMTSAEARTVLDAGRWTDDRLARAYLAGEQFSIADRFRAWLRGDDLTTVARERAVNEIARMREGARRGR